MGLVGLVPSCRRALVGSSWIPNFFSWVFHGSQIFSRGYFVGPSFFSWVFRRFKIFSLEQFRNFMVFVACEKIAQKHI